MIHHREGLRERQNLFHVHSIGAAGQFLPSLSRDLKRYRRLSTCSAAPGTSYSPRPLHTQAGVPAAPHAPRVNHGPSPILFPLCSIPCPARLFGAETHPTTPLSCHLRHQPSPNLATCRSSTRRRTPAPAASQNSPATSRPPRALLPGRPDVSTRALRTGGLRRKRAIGMRRFMPGGGGEPSSSPSSAGGKHHHQHGERGTDRAAAAGGLRYGGPEDISLGHGHPQLGVGGNEERQQDRSVDMLSRNSSSPAGFFSNLVMDNGHPSSKAGGSGAEPRHHHHPSTVSNVDRKMKPSSHLNFTRAQQQAAGSSGHLTQMSEDGSAFPPGLIRGDRSSGESSGAASRSFSGGFSIVGPWEESRDIIATLGAYDPQFSGAIASSALERAGMDRYMQLQQDQVPFKVRAKRGCATHPRSIAERERRTRISEKLRKLQELVPNMDKQTSTADMLELAVEHIKGLQSELQNLKNEQEKCTCCRKRWR